MERAALAHQSVGVRSFLDAGSVLFFARECATDGSSDIDFTVALEDFTPTLHRAMVNHGFRAVSEFGRMNTPGYEVAYIMDGMRVDIFTAIFIRPGEIDTLPQSALNAVPKEIIQQLPGYWAPVWVNARFWRCYYFGELKFQKISFAPNPMANQSIVFDLIVDAQDYARQIYGQSWGQKDPAWHWSESLSNCIKQ
eukprot:195496_1